MVKKDDKIIDRLQHKKFQGVYDPNVPKDELLDLLKLIFNRFTIQVCAVWSEPDSTRPGEWHTHFLIDTKDTMYLSKEESLVINNVEPTLTRIESKEHLKNTINYSLKHDKNVLHIPSDYPYPTEYKEPMYMRKTNENNTTPESLVSLSTCIKDGSVDLLRSSGSISNYKSIIRMLARGEPIIVIDQIPPELEFRSWQGSYTQHLAKKEFCTFEEAPETAIPLSRFNIVFSPLPSQGFNFMLEYFLKYVQGTAWIKVDTEDSMAHNIHNIYTRNGLKPIKNIMFRIDDTTIIPRDFDSAMNNFLNRKIVAKVGGYTAEIPTESQIDITAFTHFYVPEKTYQYHTKRLRYHILDREYNLESTSNLDQLLAKYSTLKKFSDHLTSLR